MPGHHFVSSILTRASALGVRRTTGSTICKEASLSQSPEHSTCTFGYVIVLICSKRQFPAQRLAQSRLHVPSQALATRRSLCHETSSTHFWRMYLVYSAPTLPIQVSQESCTSLDTIEAQIHGQHVAGLRSIKGYASSILGDVEMQTWLRFHDYNLSHRIHVGECQRGDTHISSPLQNGLRLPRQTRKESCTANPALSAKPA